MSRCFFVPSISLAAIVLGACGSQRTPSSPTPAPSSPPTAPTVTNVSIAGYPAFLRVGASARLTATASFSDGSTHDVLADWSTSNPYVAQVNYPSTLQTLHAGEADITATWTEASATAHIVVLEPASFQEISGVVHEAGVRAGLALPDARVEISGGPHNGLFVMTDIRGRFDFPDVFDSGIDLWVSRRGYQNTRFRVALLPRDKVADIAMPPTARIVQQIFDGTLVPDCVEHDASRSLRFTPRNDGVLFVSEQRILAFEPGLVIYRGSTRLDPLGRGLVDGMAVDLVGGVEHELSVGGYCGPSDPGSFHVVFTRPE
jgi:hypothetical protein